MGKGKFTCNQFDWTVLLNYLKSIGSHHVVTSHLLCHYNCLSDFYIMGLELLDWFLYDGKIGFKLIKLIKIQLCETKMSVTKTGSRPPTHIRQSSLWQLLQTVNRWKCYIPFGPTDNQHSNFMPQVEYGSNNSYKIS